MQAEADAVLADTMTVPDYQKIRELRYIEAVAHETMRLKPVAPFVGMQALADVMVNQIQIPKGMPALLLLRPKGLEESEFAVAAEFRPEHWLDYSRQDNKRYVRA